MVSAMSNNTLGAFMEEELVSQPEVWQRAIEQSKAEHLLPADGERIAVVGCGTSWFMAQSYAAAREAAGKGVTDAFAASEAFLNHNSAGRQYDAVIAITRSGTTTEVLELLEALRGKVRTIAVIGDVNSPITTLADAVIGLPYADEKSVVQTRFATTALVYLLTSLGIELGTAIEDARPAVAEPVSQELLDAEQFTFLGTGWTVGLAHEAGLKMREAVQGWTESYPAMEYRHGPISIAAPGRVTWIFGPQPEAWTPTWAAPAPFTSIPASTRSPSWPGSIRSRWRGHAYAASIPTSRVTSRALLS
ncbi:glutamine--fructose-6-phosphate aminotransferase [isomerizing] [Arthrobacter sp. Hiyo8]|nr:glutamine--fructose-6-phosphate aminotransferase [isomerizing] [Arthrobacter sp. Hiyo8]